LPPTATKKAIVSSSNHKTTMPPKGKTGGAGYAQNRRNHDRAAAEALQEMIPEEYFDETLSATDYTTEGKAMMAAKAYITALRVSKAAPSSPSVLSFQYSHIQTTLGQPDAKISASAVLPHGITCIPADVTNIPPYHTIHRRHSFSERRSDFRCTEGEDRTDQ
jgi:hypothetical protein